MYNSVGSAPQLSALRAPGSPVKRAHRVCFLPGLNLMLTPVLCFQVVLLGIDIISALVSRLQDRFKAQIGTGKGWE